MARTAIALTSPPGRYPALPLTADSAKIPLVAADNVNGNSFTSTGRELLVINNPTAGALTVTVHSVADQYLRSGDITAYSIPAGETHVLGPFPGSGWKQSDGTIWVDYSATGLMVAVLTLPSMP